MATISNEERLFSLVLALLATETGLTKTDILSTVQGYRQRYRTGGDNASLERQFERDKDDVRELGVPLETIELPVDAGAAQFARYRIPKGAYDLPADVTFTPKQLALLNLAALVWREGSMSRDSRRALTKLRSLGIESDEPLIGYAPRLRARDAGFEPLSDAIAKEVEVTFAYLKPGERKPLARRVAPLALVQFAGRWHVYGIDVERSAPRTFLLLRIVGGVKVTSRRFARPSGDHASVALAALRDLTAANSAALTVVPGTDAAYRLGARSVRTGATTLELHYSDLDLLADELASFGPEVFVDAPAELAAAVHARLSATADAHRGAAHG